MDIRRIVGWVGIALVMGLALSSVQAADEPVGTTPAASGAAGTGEGWVPESTAPPGQIIEEAVPGGPKGRGRFLERIESYSSYRWIDRELNFISFTPFGTLPVRVESDLDDSIRGFRVFSTQSPLPLLDMSYRMSRDESDTTLFAPLPMGPVTMGSTDHDHDYHVGLMLPVPNVGLFKFGATDVEASSTYGVYAVPRVGPASFKLGFEWSNNERVADDRLYFGAGTLAYEDWVFTLGASDRLLGYTMAGGQVGRWFGSWFAGAGVYWVENDDPAFGLMVGRGAAEGQKGPSFWLVHLNNPYFRQTNMQIALGSPGIPKEALNNPFMNGVYTGMFTDQMGTVVPIPVRNFEEMRIWKRTDEYAQEGAGGWGGLAMSLNAIATDFGYEVFDTGLFYTHPRVGPLLYPHVGPVLESERLPGVGRQDWRAGLEFGTYFWNRTPTQYFRAGHVYVGVRALSDFDDYSSIMAEMRLNL